MRSAIALLQELNRGGITIYPNASGGIHYRARSGRLPLPVRETILQHKAELLQQLKTVPALSLCLSDFALAGLLLPVYLPPVGELIWLASDNAPIPVDADGLHKGRVIYYAREWRALYALRIRGDLDDESLRLLHEAKKVFGGELLSPHQTVEQYSAQSGDEKDVSE